MNNNQFTSNKLCLDEPSFTTRFTSSFLPINKHRFFEARNINTYLFPSLLWRIPRPTKISEFSQFSKLLQTFSNEHILKEGRKNLTSYFSMT